MGNELDGVYRISTTTNYQGPLEKKSDGITEIRDSQTHRRDDANCLWTSHFNIISENEVEMISIADPREADGNFSLMRPDGSPTRDIVEYKSSLKFARKTGANGEDMIQLSGQIEYGDELIFITMRKTGELDA